MSMIKDVRRHVAPFLMALPGVVGVGIGTASIRVYVAKQTPELDEAIKAIMHHEAYAIIYFVIESGEFHAL